MGMYQNELFGGRRDCIIEDTILSFTFKYTVNLYYAQGAILDAKVVCQKIEASSSGLSLWVRRSTQLQTSVCNE